MIKFSAKLTPRYQASDQASDQALLTVQPWEVENLKQLDTEKLYVVEVKEFKSKRSLEQNRLMWELIEQINLKLNGWRADKESAWTIYQQILIEANIQKEYIACLEETISKLIGKDSEYRAFEKTGYLRTEDNKILVKGWIYKGSSKFNTEEMSRFIDALLDYAIESGVDVREYDY